MTSPVPERVVIINFGHPLTAENCCQIEKLVGAPIAKLIDRPVQFDRDLPFTEQARALVAGTELDRDDW